MAGFGSDGRYITYHVPSGSFRTRMIGSEELWAYISAPVMLALGALGMLCLTPTMYGVVDVARCFRVLSFVCAALAFVSVLCALKNERGWSVVALLTGLGCIAEIRAVHTADMLVPTVFLLGLGAGRMVYHWITRAIWEPVLLVLILSVLLGVLAAQTQVDMRVVYAGAFFCMLFSFMAACSIWMSAVAYEHGLTHIDDGGE